MIVRLYDVTGKKIYRGDQQIMIPLENDICILKGFIYKVKLRTWLFETSTRSKNICHLLVEEVGTETGGLYKEKETANNSDQPETVNVIKQFVYDKWAHVFYSQTLPSLAPVPVIAQLCNLVGSNCWLSEPPFFDDFSIGQMTTALAANLNTR